MKRAGGVTLMELIVTLTIVGIVAALAIPYFNQAEVDATWFHEQTKSAVRYAQRQTVAQRRSVFVAVGPGTVELCYDAGCGSRVPQIATGAPFILTAPSGVTLTPASFSFNGLGQPNPIAGASFSVAGKSVVVTAETGYVQ